ncbi:MAG: GNAT family N-acetyltransferase [Deltaproteobacteria bacterium]|nr:GNAT family N-acetyltransferase [Deltaproteobacteria bacterium]MBI3295526.1 GNAT family N-acetyltransferase [Deltaproteobacteria bacterium]
MEWPEPKRSREDVIVRIFGAGKEDQLPQTLVLHEEAGPIGYSTILLYEKGRSSGQIHWIDAVYVKPEKRKRGLWTKLILAAEGKAKALGASEVFALTDIPILYQKLSWTICETRTGTASGSVMSKKL